MPGAKLISRFATIYELTERRRTMGTFLLAFTLCGPDGNPEPAPTMENPLIIMSLFPPKSGRRFQCRSHRHYLLPCASRKRLSKRIEALLGSCEKEGEGSACTNSSRLRLVVQVFHQLCLWPLAGHLCHRARRPPQRRRSPAARGWTSERAPTNPDQDWRHAQWRAAARCATLPHCSQQRERAPLLARQQLPQKRSRISGDYATAQAVNDSLLGFCMPAPTVLVPRDCQFLRFGLPSARRARSAPTGCGAAQLVVDRVV